MPIIHSIRRRYNSLRQLYTTVYLPLFSAATSPVVCHYLQQSTLHRARCSSSWLRA